MVLFMQIQIRKESKIFQEIESKLPKLVKFPSKNRSVIVDAKGKQIKAKKGYTHQF